MSFLRAQNKNDSQCEDDIIKQCRAYLGRAGYFLQRNPVGLFKTVRGTWVEFGPEGIPDYTAIHATYPSFYIEFKRPGARLRDGQVTVFAKVQIGFQLAAVMIDSIDELAVWLNGHERRARERFATKTESAA